MFKNLVIISITLTLIIVMVMLVLPDFMKEKSCFKCAQAKREMREIGRAWNSKINNNTKKQDPWGGLYEIHFVNVSDKNCMIIWTLGADAILGGSTPPEKDIILLLECS